MLRQDATAEYIVLGTLILAIVGGSFLFSGRIAAQWAKYQASRCLVRYSLSEAIDWLNWGNRLAADGVADVLRVKAYRQLNRDSELYSATLQNARRHGAVAAKIDQESRLQAIEAGEWEGPGEQVLNELIAAGQSPHDICTAFVFGFLHRQDVESARRVLDAWGQDYPNEPHVAYIRGDILEIPWRQRSGRIGIPHGVKFRRAARTGFDCVSEVV